MRAGIYLNFTNRAAEALAFYEDVFKTKATNVMHFSDLPDKEQMRITDDMDNLVMNASMEIHGMPVMFSDVPEGMGMELVVGNNISIVISIEDEATLEKEFNQLAEDGKIIMPLQTTFWSKKYGYLIDSFGIGWQFSLAQ